MNEGKVYYLTLPIGNLKDISFNVLDSLREGTYFYVEDTRTFKSVLRLYEIDYSKKIIKSFHDQSLQSSISDIPSLIKSGHNVYYCSEAGSPVVSDPGVSFLKILDKIECDVEVISYGGVCSIISALEVSKVSFSKFMFHGFFPRDKASKFKALELAKGVSKTHVFFESPHRVHKTLNFLLTSESLCPDEIYVCRELTKKFQEVIKLKVGDNPSKAESIKAKGEFVLVLNYLGSEELFGLDKSIINTAEEILNGNSKPKMIAKLLAKITNRPVKDVYVSLEKNLKKY